MELNQITPATGVGTDGCVQCGSPLYEEGYKVQLCPDCRTKLSRYPVDKKVKWAAVGIGILMLISFYRFPSAFKARLSYERAMKAEDEHRYMSAEKELRKTLQLYPENLKTSAHLLIAAFKNDHLKAVDSIADRWSGATSKEESILLERVNELLTVRGYYFLPDSAFGAQYQRLLTGDTAAKAWLLQYAETHPTDVAVAYLLAKSYYNEGNFTATDSVCGTLLDTVPDFHPVYLLLAASYREQKRFGEAAGVCKKLLTRNTESVPGNTLLAQMLLKQGRDREALQKALLAYSWAPDDKDVMQVLALAYYFNHNNKESDQLLARVRQRDDTSGLANTLSIIRGEITYRD